MAEYCISVGCRIRIFGYHLKGNKGNATRNSIAKFTRIRLNIYATGYLHVAQKSRPRCACLLHLPPTVASHLITEKFPSAD